jgi:serine/threonine-protein kinase
MGVIERAQDERLLREIAVKRLHPHRSRDNDARRRLVEEAQITAQLEHPGVVPVYDLDVDEEGTPFFTMALVRGQTLRDILWQMDYTQRTYADLYRLLMVFIRVCDALSYAHSRGVLHRDLKPANIMVGEFGEVYLMDWGIARLHRPRPSARDVEMPETTQDQRRASEGTPCYMAPEQARGESDAIDERTDVFAMGAILYEILTQAPPFFGTNAFQVLYKASECLIVPPQELTSLELPPRICAIAMRAMAKEPEERHQSVRELREDIESFLTSGWQFLRRTYPKDTLIVRQGDPGDEAFIILKGRCRVFGRTDDGNEVPWPDLKAGDVFGEISVFSGRKRSASVQALEDVSLAVVTRKNFEEMGLGHCLGLFVKALADRFLEKEKELLDHMKRP